MAFAFQLVQKVKYTFEGAPLVSQFVKIIHTEKIVQNNLTLFYLVT